MKSIPKTLAIRLGSMLATAALLFSCATAPTIESMVSEEAAMYLQISQPEPFFADMDDFMAGLGLDGLTEGQGLKRYLLNVLDREGSPLASEDLDLTRTVGLVAIPKLGSKDFDILIMLPVKSGTDLSGVLDAFEGSGAYPVAYKDYLVISTAKELRDEFPPKGRLDIKRFRGGPAGSVQGYLGLGQLFDAMGLDLDELRTTLAASPEGNNPAVQRMANAYIDFFAQLESLWYTVNINGSGISLGSQTKVKDPLGLFLKMAHPVKGTRKLGAYLGDGNVAQIVYNIDKRDQKMATDKLMALVYGEEIVSKPEYKALMENYRAMNAAAGSRGAFSLGISQDEGEAMGGPLDGLAFEFKGLTELDRPDAYRQALVRMMADNSAQKLAEGLYADLGMSFSTQYEEKKTPDGETYWELRYSIRGTPGDDPQAQIGKSPEAAALSFMDTLRTYYLIRDKLCFMYLGFGDGDIETRFLDAVAQDPFAPRSADAASWLQSVPDDASVAWKIELNGIMSYVARVMQQGNGQVGPLAEEPAPITGFFTADADLSGGVVVPSDELVWMIQSFQNLK